MKPPITLLAALALLATPALAAKPNEGQERASDLSDKIVCKRFVETGSLVKGYRVCQPKRDWDRQREDRRTLSVSNSCRDTANGGGLCG